MLGYVMNTDVESYWAGEYTLRGVKFQSFFDYALVFGSFQYSLLFLIGFADFLFFRGQCLLLTIDGFYYQITFMLQLAPSGLTGF
jgi:hypothetical protein